MHSTEELVQAVGKGEMVILMDDETRENEGDFVVAASHITPKILNFMLQKARGLICLAITRKQAHRLHLPLMVNTSIHKDRTAFTVSVDAAKGISSGASVFDRVHTLKVASDPSSTPEDLVRPGHVFPIIAKDNGVLDRAGHTEGSLDLVRLAGLPPSAVICEVLREDGLMARRSDLECLAKEHNLKIGCIADLIAYRHSKKNQSL